MVSKRSLDLVPGLAQSYADLLKALAANPAALAQIQQKYLTDQSALLMRMGGARQDDGQAGQTGKADRRFAAAEWQQYPLFDYLRLSYELGVEALLAAVEAAKIDEATKKKLRFFARQYADALAPSNFALTNPEVLKLAADTHGQSLIMGIQNLIEDLEQGRIAMTDESAFEVGKNLALTPGAVVFENELIQLIQYRPSTKTVYERPIVLVPPCINKFYIMDLQPDNSFVRYLIEQGHTVFMVSWRNVEEDQQQLSWDDYLRLGVIKALDVARAITKQDQVNALGFCVGGTLLASALSVLAAKRLNWVKSQTLLTALLDFSDVGEIGAYVDRHFVEQREREFSRGGLMHGRELAEAFSSLRPNDLIWNYVVSNYLKGKKPEAFDLLYWNSDSTNLPGPMFAYYLRHFYLDNELIQPGKLKMCGVQTDLGKAKLPTYVFAAIEDHIVPWKGAYSGARALGGKVEFVLGASGHIAGSMNSAYRDKRNYWVAGKADGKGAPRALPAQAEQWSASAQLVPGSWWKHWVAWLAQFGGAQLAARTKPGDRKYREIEAAPGRYVKQRVR